MDAENMPAIRGKTSSELVPLNSIVSSPSAQSPPIYRITNGATPRHAREASQSAVVAFAGAVQKPRTFWRRRCSNIAVREYASVLEMT